MYSYAKNMMINQYYDPNPDVFLNKTSADLAFNIRTHYHALNDHARGWGVSVEMPAFLKRVNALETKARLLNQFNPAPPKTDLLIVFGFEAMMNWYPNEADRDAYGLNDSKTQIFNKAEAVWNAGYINALIPADQITNGKLKLDEKISWSTTDIISNP